MLADFSGVFWVSHTYGEWVAIGHCAGYEWNRKDSVVKKSEEGSTKRREQLIMSGRRIKAQINNPGITERNAARLIHRL